MKRLIAIAAILTAVAAHAQEVTKLTFHDALERAEKVNNSVERARADVSVAEANKEQLLSNVLPRITLNGAAQRNSETVAFNTGGNDVTVLPRNDWNYHLNFAQPVYAGRRELRAYSQAKIGILNAQQGVLGTEDAVLLRIASNYLGVVNADNRIAIEQRNIDVAQKRRAQASAFYEAGESTKVDVLCAALIAVSARRTSTLVDSPAS